VQSVEKWQGGGALIRMGNLYIEGGRALKSSSVSTCAKHTQRVNMCKAACQACQHVQSTHTCSLTALLLGGGAINKRRALIASSVATGATQKKNVPSLHLCVCVYTQAASSREAPAQGSGQTVGTEGEGEAQGGGGAASGPFVAVAPVRAAIGGRERTLVMQEVSLHGAQVLGGFACLSWVGLCVFCGWVCLFVVGGFVCLLWVRLRVCLGWVCVFVYLWHLCCWQRVYAAGDEQCVLRVWMLTGI